MHIIRILYVYLFLKNNLRLYRVAYFCSLLHLPTKVSTILFNKLYYQWSRTAKHFPKSNNLKILKPVLQYESVNSGYYTFYCVQITKLYKLQNTLIIFIQTQNSFSFSFILKWSDFLKLPAGTEKIYGVHFCGVKFIIGNIKRK